MKYTFEILFGLALLFVLYKFNLIKLPLNLFFRKRYSAKKLSLNYMKYNGVSHHNFLLKNGRNYTANYDVIVESGSVTINLKGIFTKTFHSSETDSFSFTANNRINGAAITEDYTKGGCKIEMVEKQEK